MASTTTAATETTAKGKAKTGEQIIAGFKALKGEQRALFLKLSELEDDFDEHRIVVETLKQVDENRKCFRLVGNVLCERTVKEVMPALVVNKEQLAKVITSLNEQLTRKAQEITQYKETYNIRIKGIDEIPQEHDNAAEAASQTKSNVLVSDN